MNRIASMLDALVWREDEMLLDGLVFRLQDPAKELESGDDCFRFYKSRALVDQYERFWSARGFAPASVFELGVWDGGSVAFWFELFRPLKHVAIDVLERGDSEYFRRYVQTRSLESRIRTHWGVDQSAASRLLEIYETEFDGPLDLVIDDASHIYGPTRSSFETLFPLLRPGGLYVIEDWAWEHWQGFQSPDHPWAAEKGLSPLLLELAQAIGSDDSLVASLAVFQGFAVVERGPRETPPSLPVDLESLIVRRPRLTSSSHRVEQAIEELKAATPIGATLLLVDDDTWGVEGSIAGHPVLPFLEKSGYSFGPPDDDATAIAELDRMHRAGARFLVFAWPAFWWLEYYTGFAGYVRTRFPCVLDNERLLVYDLRVGVAVGGGR